MSSDYW